MRKEKKKNGGKQKQKHSTDEESRIPVFHKNQPIREREKKKKKKKEKKALQTDYSQQEAIGLITAASNTGP